jgi:hypothetical protein
MIGPPPQQTAARKFVAEAVVAGGDAAEVLEAAEHALDGVATAVEGRREAILPASVGLGRDVRHCAGRLDLAADRVGVVALVAMQDAARRQPFEELRSSRAIRHLSARQHESKRAAQLVGQGMDLGRPSAARAADCLIELPPLPPDAER